MNGMGDINSCSSCKEMDREDVSGTSTKLVSVVVFVITVRIMYDGLM